jgi:hypothetical protein
MRAAAKRPAGFHRSVVAAGALDESEQQHHRQSRPGPPQAAIKPMTLHDLFGHVVVVKTPSAGAKVHNVDVGTIGR